MLKFHFPVAAHETSVTVVFALGAVPVTKMLASACAKGASRGIGTQGGAPLHGGKR